MENSYLAPQNPTIPQYNATKICCIGTVALVMVVVAVASIIFISIGATNVFGPPLSIGSLTSLIGGGTFLTSDILAGIILIAILVCKRQKNLISINMGDSKHQSDKKESTQTHIDKSHLDPIPAPKTQENKLLEAIKSNNIEEAGRLIAAGTKLRSATEGEQPLILAIQYGRLEIVRQLIERDRGIINIYTDGAFGLFPIHKAASGNKLDILQLLIENYDVDPMKKDFGQGRTPLHHAAENGNLEIVKYLVEEARVDVNALNNSGMTAYELTCLNYDIECQTVQRYRRENRYLYFRPVDPRNVSQVLNYLDPLTDPASKNKCDPKVLLQIQLAGQSGEE